LSTDAVVTDSGLPDPVAPDAGQIAVEKLPEEAIVFLLASRFCDSVRLLDLAWTLFKDSTPGWARVQAICDFVNQRINFGYEHARVTRTASEAYQEGLGVCRDYTHLAVAFSRALNIPARYCTGYLGDAGTPPPFPPGDSRRGSRSISAGNGIRSMHGTTSLGSAGYCWRGDAMRRMSRLQQRSAPIRSRASRSGPTKFWTGLVSVLL
jgi:transglutaminase-like putative cysteine protease